MEINIDVSNNFLKHLEGEDKFFTISQGGASSSKTYSIIQLIILSIIKNRDKNYLYTICQDTYQSLKRGCIRDFQNILMNLELWDENDWNRTDKQYKLFGNIIEFVALDSPSKARGSRRDFLFINECNLLPYETCSQLIIRTRKKVYLDFNPVERFWIHEEYIDNINMKDKIHYVHSTYKDNQFLEQIVIDNMIERGKKDSNFKRVFIDGLPGTLEGVIFDQYTLIDEIPEQIKRMAKKQYIGLDWGWKDETAASSIYILGSKMKPVEDIYIDEILYEGGLKNNEILNKIIQKIEVNNYEVVADNSEPKSIDEMKVRGLNIRGVEKGAGSVVFGIELLQQANIYVTKSSLNLIKEFRNYRWDIDEKTKKVKRDLKGKPIPIDNWNHLIDGIRYVASTHNNYKFEYKPVKNKDIHKGLVIA